MKVGVISLGCVKNRVDTEQMLAVLKDHGYEFTDLPEEADILIVNTCGFINPAKEESIDTLLEMAQYKEGGRCRLLCATGCLSQRYGDEMAKDMPEIDLIVGISQYDILPKLIEEALQGKRVLETSRRKQALCSGRVLTTKPYSAYVRIAEGCDNRCAYCAIPLIRGGHVSRSEEDVLNEMTELARNGAAEQILVAQDTTRFGKGYDGQSLEKLMDKAARIEGIKWLRVLYCYPDETPLSLIDTMAKHDNICKYLDLPLQHAAPEVLKRMNRRGDIRDIEALLMKARQNGFALRTTFIVGFPGETEEDFDLLMDFTRRMAFDHMGAFAYSPEDDTKAADMADQIPEKVKEERLNRLMALQRQIAKERKQSRVGQTVEVLITGRRGGQYLARSAWEAPDADGEIMVKSQTPLREGQYYPVRIVRADAYDYAAEFVEEA